MNLVCADTGGIPLLFAPGDGNRSDRENVRALAGFSRIRKRASGGG
jgi:hypothetical protein